MWVTLALPGSVQAYIPSFYFSALNLIEFGFWHTKVFLLSELVVMKIGIARFNSNPPKVLSEIDPIIRVYSYYIYKNTYLVIALSHCELL